MTIVVNRLARSVVAIERLEVFEMQFNSPLVRLAYTKPWVRGKGSVVLNFYRSIKKWQLNTADI